MMIRSLGLLAIALMASVTASAQARTEIPLPPSQNPSNAVLPVAGAVWAGNDSLQSARGRVSAHRPRSA